MGGFPFWLKPKLVWVGATYPTICVTNIYKHLRETTTSFFFFTLWKTPHFFPFCISTSTSFLKQMKGPCLLAAFSPWWQMTNVALLWWWTRCQMINRLVSVFSESLSWKHKNGSFGTETRQKRLKNIEITTRQFVESRTSNSRECSSWKFQLWI